MTKEVKNPLETKKISKLLMKFSIPCVISMLVGSLYNIVDQIFIGQEVNYLGNAATNVVFPLVIITLGIALLIGNGAASFFSLNLGEKDFKEAKKGVGNSITLITITSIVFLIVCLIFLPQLLDLFGCTEAVKSYALIYGRIIVIGIPFSMISTSINSLIRADGNPKYSMMSMVVGAIINVVLDALFLIVFKWGIAGAAWATIIGQFVSFILSIIYINKFKSIKLEKKDFKLDFGVIKRILGYGTSSFITQITITIVMIVMNNYMVKYGGASKYGTDIPLAVFGIVLKVSQIITSIIVGIAVGAQPIIGYNYGAKNYVRVKQTVLATLKVSLVIGIVGTIIFLVFPHQLINIFGSESELYEEFAIQCFRIYLLFTILNSIQITISIFFQSLGKAVKSTILSLSRQIVFLIPLIIILSSIMGLNGTLYAAPVADLLAFILAIILFIYEYKKIGTEKAINL